MITLFTLWLPILMSAVAVFVVSSIIHMSLQYHKNDFIGLPNEKGVRDALRGFNIPPGNYHFPHAGSEYLIVARVTGTVAFCGYSLALLQNSIWYKRGWSATLKSMFDGLVYALLTGGFFGWLWPGVA